MDKEEVFEKVPDFIGERQPHPEEQPQVKEEQGGEVEEEDTREIEVEKLALKLSAYSDEERTEFKKAMAYPSRLKVDQSVTLIDFDSYKGDISLLFNELSILYQAMNRWSTEIAFNTSELFQGIDFNILIGKLAYLPQHKYLANLLEIIASLIEEGNLNIGSNTETETLFQSFKRIYLARIQAILLPFLHYMYDLDKKLMPVKKTAWQLLNKNGRLYEASYIMDDIQKNTIRIKKAQELLIQETFNLDEKIRENVNILYFLSEKNDVLQTVYKVYRELKKNPELNLEQAFQKEYNLSNLPVKPLSQQLLTYKTGTAGEKITNKLSLWSGKASGPDYKIFFHECFRETLKNVEPDAVNFPLMIRDIVFSVMELAKRKGQVNHEVIRDMLIATLNSVEFTSINKLKQFSYIFAGEVICGVVKVKYKIEEAVQGLAKGLVFLIPESFLLDNHYFSRETCYKIACEFVYNGMWDTILEIFPNIQMVEKNADLFLNIFKSETQKQKILKEEQELKEIQKNLIISSTNL